MKKKWFYVSVIVPIIIVFIIGIGTRSSKLIIASTPSIESLPGTNIYGSLVNELNTNEQLYLVSYYGGCFQLDFFPDGTIDDLFWEMAYPNNDGKFSYLQIRGRDYLYGSDVINIDNTYGDKIELQRFLETLGNIPMGKIMDILPTGDLYSMSFKEVHQFGDIVTNGRNDSGNKENVKRFYGLPGEKVYKIDTKGVLTKVNASDITEIDTTTLEMPISVMEKDSEISYIGRTQIILLVELRDFS